MKLNEVIDDTERAMRKLVLRISELFPHKFTLIRNLTDDENFGLNPYYEATTGSGEDLVQVVVGKIYKNSKFNMDLNRIQVKVLHTLKNDPATSLSMLEDDVRELINNINDLLESILPGKNNGAWMHVASVAHSNKFNQVYRRQFDAKDILAAL